MVSEIMPNRRPIIIEEDKTVETALKELTSSGQSELVVVDSNKNPRKVVTRVDLIGEDKTIPIASISNKLPAINVVKPTDGIDSIRSNLSSRPFTVVLEGGNFVSLLKPMDLIDFWKKRI